MPKTSWTVVNWFIIKRQSIYHMAMYKELRPLCYIFCHLKIGCSEENTWEMNQVKMHVEALVTRHQFKIFDNFESQISNNNQQEIYLFLKELILAIRSSWLKIVKLSYATFCGSSLNSMFFVSICPVFFCGQL